LNIIFVGSVKIKEGKRKEGDRKESRIHLWRKYGKGIFNLI